MIFDLCPLVVKIGGGLLRAEGVEGLRQGCEEAIALSSSRPVLVVPGGGPFADAVRALDAQVGLAVDVAHLLALQAMDQLGVLLRALLPGAERLTSLVPPRSLGLLAAALAFAGRPEIPESWAVTSDSLAVLAAAAIGAEETVLLKPAPGVLARWPSDDAPIPRLTAGELQTLQDAGGGGPSTPTCRRPCGAPAWPSWCGDPDPPTRPALASPETARTDQRTSPPGGEPRRHAEPAISSRRRRPWHRTHVPHAEPDTLSHSGAEWQVLHDHDPGRFARAPA